MSKKRMVYAEDVIQRIRDLAPEILGGWYNPDMENELEQLVCVVENTPTAAAQDAQRWRNTAEEPPEGRRRRLLRPRSDRPRRCPLRGRYVLTVRQREPGGGPRLDAASETTVGGRKMSKAVLLSIRPEWCQKIFRGEKTMEIRKSFPKDFRGQPFKCFIYCTKGQNLSYWKAQDHFYFDDRSHNAPDRCVDGMIIGEFTCDRVYEIAPLNHAPDDLEAQACMDRDQIWEYTRGKGYAWHITELKAYVAPRDLAAFHLRCENALRFCNNSGCAMRIERPANGNCCGNYALQLNRPPQSWCYVVGPGECHKELQEQVKATLGRLYPRKKISDILPKPEILGQLAEELAEASAAASKLRRKIDGKNPTPKTLEECWEDLKKEIGDVMNSIDALTEQDPQNYHEFMSECGEYAEPKMERWLFRLNEQKEEHA